MPDKTGRKGKPTPRKGTKGQFMRVLRERGCSFHEHPNGADDGTRTRDPDLGKVVLYQLSYIREAALCRKLQP